MKRQQSSTSSEGKTDFKRRQNKPAHMLVNYIDKEEGLTYTVAVNACMCNDSARNNNLEPKPLEIKETVVEENGNVQIDLPTLPKPEPILDNVIPDVAKV